MASTTIDLATYQYNLELNSEGFSSGMSSAEGNVDKLEGKFGGFTSFLKGAVIGGIATVGVALVGMGLKGIKSADELQQSLNKLSMQTGATAEETKQLEESLTNIYANNFGESFDDIAQSMATVKQTMGLTGKELESTTQTALMMRDTFDMDVGESIDTVNALMANFGITAEQAYNLMAQGAQQGANKNGDLTEVLKEYAPHFSQLGISAEEFTDTLIQGAKSGAFQMDKVGDAVKEFGIRSKDMSDASAQGFEALGLNADEMFNTFAQGGDGAQKAFQDVISRLGQLNDPLAQNAAGVALFGTQFEDLGINGIKALADIGDYAKLDIDALGQINSVKYDSFGEALTGIKRGLETDILIPMGQKVLPIINELATWVQTNMPQIKGTIGNALNFVGEVLISVGELIGVLISILQNFYTENQVIFDGITLIIKTAFDIIIGVFNVATALLKGDWSTFGTELTNLTQKVFELIKAIFKTSFDIIKSLLTTAIGNFLSLGYSIMNALFDAFKSVWSSITSWLGSSITNAVSSIKGFASSFYSSGYQLFSSFWDGIKSVWSNLKSWFNDTISWIKDKLSIWDSAQSKMSSKDDSKDDIPAYAVGTPFVPNDQIALIHQGEAIIPAQYNPFNPANKTTLSSSAGMPAVFNNSITFNVSGGNGLTKKEMDKAAGYVFGSIITNLKKVGVK
ncbi:phage tail tape measure protein [Desulfosporosinus youngiae]|uniref:Phage tail tape measure protein, TP901 family n=1 Tax=Desulfosporosinus youngiae DSM 17734 TaxID=768710 RepID=H5Y562_9FIRM|nr:phage tail tape measure protein [Desulfosporosinus youngiae]EHQ90166.1 phage tail tape measure protein, TP901 family [Desulfosporosinus youngiae DSM 17734]